MPVVKELREAVKQALPVYRRMITREYPLEMPIFAYFGGHVTFTDQPYQEKFPSRLDGYSGALDDNTLEMGHCLAFICDQYFAASQGSCLIPHMKAIEDATLYCSHALTSMVFLPKEKTYEVSLGGSPKVLLDGLKGADLMQVVIPLSLGYRATLLNPQYGSEITKRSHGHVLVDSTDLSPTFHQRLQETFPRVRFTCPKGNPLILLP